MAKYALSTFDNPFNPITQFEKWFEYDEEKGYHSSGYLGRIARTSNSLSDEENDAEIERAIDEIVSLDFMGIYVKVAEDTKTPIDLSIRDDIQTEDRSSNKDD